MEENQKNEKFMKKFWQMAETIDKLMSECELCGEISLIYDILDNRTRRCNNILTNEMGENWWENFNHFFTGD